MREDFPMPWFFRGAGRYVPLPQHKETVLLRWIQAILYKEIRIPLPRPMHTTCRIGAYWVSHVMPRQVFWAESFWVLLLLVLCYCSCYWRISWSLVNLNEWLIAFDQFFRCLHLCLACVMSFTFPTYLSLASSRLLRKPRLTKTKHSIDRSVFH